MHLAELIPVEKLCALFDTLTDRHVDSRVGHLRFSAALLLSLGVEEMTTNYPARMIVVMTGHRRPLLRNV